MNSFKKPELINLPDEIMSLIELSIQNIVPIKMVHNDGFLNIGGQAYDELLLIKIRDKFLKEFP